MKKAKSLIFLCALLVCAASVFPTSVSAAVEPAPFSLEIPKAVNPPVLDGNVDASGEWKDAWHGVLDSDKPGGVRADTLSPKYHATYDYYMMWDEINLYIACVCKGDKTTAPAMRSGLDTQDNNVRGDGFQVFLNPTTEPGKNGKSFFHMEFYCEYAAGVKPFWWEYQIYDGDNETAMANELNITIAPKRSGENWTIEVCLPWDDIATSYEGAKDQWNNFKGAPAAAGLNMRLDFASMDFTGDADNCRRQELSVQEDGGFYADINMFYTFKTVSAPAGTIPEAPEIEVAAFEAPAPAAAAAVPVVSVPQTGDNMSIMFSIIVVICAAGVFAGVKKSAERRRKLF